MEIDLIPVLTDNYIFLLSHKGQAVVIDPALAGPVRQYLKKYKLSLSHILNTHHHGDHIGGNLELQKEFGCEIWGSEKDKHRIPGITRTLKEGDDINLLGQTAKVMEVFGHTIGHIAYYFTESQSLFSGDTIFSLGCGRLFEGSAQQMWQSIQKIKSLPMETKIYCTHEYTLNNGLFAKHVDPENLDLHRYLENCEHLRGEQKPTIPCELGNELLVNPFLRADVAEFVKRLPHVKIGLEAFAYLRSLKDSF